MLFENDEISVGHCFVIKLGRVNLERECANATMLPLPIKRIFNFVSAFDVTIQL